MVSSFNAQPLTPTSAMVSWDISNSIVDNYTVSYTRLCDSFVKTFFIENSRSNSTNLTDLYSGLQYSISVIPVNILGKGIENTKIVTLEEAGMLLYSHVC